MHVERSDEEEGIVVVGRTKLMLERGLHVYLRRQPRGSLVSVQGPVLAVGIEL